MTAPNTGSAVIHESSGAPFARIYGIGGYRPSRVVTNEEICTMIDSSDEWIRTRSGIEERRWATEDETVRSMSVGAARKAIERSGVDPAEIGCVIVATVTHLHQTPAIAPTIATDLGLDDVAAFDISAACAGFCYGVAMGDALVRSGAAKYVLAIGVERLSELTDTSDRSTAFIFADGAGAAVIGPSETPGIGPVVWGSDGGHADLIDQTAGWDEYMADPADPPRLRMNGNPVFKWAAFTIAKKAQEAIDAAGLSADQLDVFVPHQANNRITDAMIRTLGLGDHVVVGRDIRRQGNASAASVPLAIEALYEEGAIHSGQNALIIGFGAGLVYAGQVIVLP